MAERRMFSKSIVNSARFLRMPQTSRLLYYDLGMAADDDGFVEAYTVIRTTGAAEDDLRVLASKGFVRVLNEDLVSYIVDWNRNNYIQKDRYNPSVYRKMFDESVTNVYTMDTECIQTVSSLDTQVRLGKDSIGKVNKKESSSTRFSPPKVEEVMEYCQVKGYSIDAESFVNFYESKGWMIGKNPMKNWKAAVSNWERRRKESERGKDDRKDAAERFEKLVVYDT